MFFPKIRGPGRLRVDLNPSRTVERKLESKRRKSRAPECLGMSRSVSNFERKLESKRQANKAKKRLGMSRPPRQTETFRDVFWRFFGYICLFIKKARRKNGRKPKTFRDVPGSWILGVVTRVSARNSKQIETFRDIPGPWIFGVLIRVSARQFEAD